MYPHVKIFLLPFDKILFFSVYRASFCQTFAEMKARTGEWKSILAITLMTAVWTALYIMWGELFGKKNSLIFTVNWWFFLYALNIACMFSFNRMGKIICKIFTIDIFYLSKYQGQTACLKSGILQELS